MDYKQAANLLQPLLIQNRTSGASQILTWDRFGGRILLDPRDLYITYHFLEHGEWEPSIRVMIHGKVDRDTLFIDVGANIGIHSLSASRVAGLVVAFEPDPISHSILQQNFLINGFPENVAVLAAVGEVSGRGLVRQNSESSGMNSILYSASGDTLIVSLDEYFLGNQEVELSQFKSLFVKVDVEGMEGDVLLGGVELFSRYERVSIVVEYHRPSSLPQALEGIIAGLGSSYDYSLRNISSESGTNWIGGLPEKIPFGDLLLEIVRRS